MSVPARAISGDRRPPHPPARPRVPASSGAGPG